MLRSFENVPSAAALFAAFGFLFVAPLAAQERLAENPTASPPAPSGRSFSILRNVVYKQAGPRRLKADLFVPNGDGPYPAVLLLHGGSWKAGSKKQMLYHGKRLAPNGYVAMSIDYRLAPRHPFPAQIEDCRTAIKFLRRHAADYKIAPDRIGAFGYSAGGHLACLLGSAECDEQEQPSWRVQAVVAGGAPCDFEIMPADSEILNYWLGGTRAEKPMIYRAASPLRAVTPDDAPMMLYHGARDALVPVFSPQRMVARLEKEGIPNEYYECAGKGHYRTFLDATAFSKAVDFLNRHLKYPPAEQAATASN